MKDGELGRIYKNDEIIFREGEPGDVMFIVQSGKVRISKKTQSGDIDLVTLGNGEIFGEMALFDHLPRSATARVVGEARIISVDKKSFFARAGKDPTLVFKILQSMSERMRKMNEELSKLKKVERNFLNSFIDSGEICRIVLEEARNNIKSDNASIMLLDENEKTLSIVAAFGVEVNPKVKLSAGKGIAGSVLNSGKAELVNNVSMDNRFLAGGTNIKSILCAPLKWKGRVFGVINLSSSTEQLFTLDDLKRLHLLSIYASIAIQNAIECSSVKNAVGDIIENATLMDEW